MNEPPVDDDPTVPEGVPGGPPTERLPGAPAQPEAPDEHVPHSALVGFMSVRVHRLLPIRRSTLLMVVAFLGFGTWCYLYPPYQRAGERHDDDGHSRRRAGDHHDHDDHHHDHRSSDHDDHDHHPTDRDHDHRVDHDHHPPDRDHDHHDQCASLGRDHHHVPGARRGDDDRARTDRLDDLGG